MSLNYDVSEETIAEKEFFTEQLGFNDMKQALARRVT